MRLSGSPDSGGFAGVALRCLYRQQSPLCDRPTVFVAQTRWGTPPGHMPGVRFATREPAAVIQTVVHCMLQNRFAGFRIPRVVGKHIGKATSRVRHLPDHRTHDTHVNSLLSRAFRCVTAWVVCSPKYAHCDFGFNGLYRTEKGELGTLRLRA